MDSASASTMAPAMGCDAQNTLCMADNSGTVKKRKLDDDGEESAAKHPAVHQWKCFPCVDKVVTGTCCPECGGDEQASDERGGEEDARDCYWHGCDLGCCPGCQRNTTSTCQRKECGADGCMEKVPCDCDCSDCNGPYDDCDCRDDKKLLPRGTLEHLAKFQAMYRGWLQRSRIMAGAV